MANTTDRELIEMYQMRLEMVALENLRLEKEKQDLVCQLQQVSSQKTIENKDRQEYEKRIEILCQENEQKQQQAEAQIRERDEKIEALYKEVCYYRRRYWGKSSERYIPQDPNQRKIEFEGLEMTDQETTLLQEAVKEVTRNKENRIKKSSLEKPVRLKLLPDLKREVITLPDPDGVNPQEWVCIGEKITEVLDYKPAEIYVKRYVRKVWALKSKAATMQLCLDDGKALEPGVLVATYPNLPFKKSNADASLLAALLIGKYMDHLPFYRQFEIFKRSGVQIAASTVNGWFKNTCDMLRALYDRLRELVLATDYIQVDESTIPIVDKKKSKTAKAYLWLVRSVMEKTQFFFYDHGSRSQKVAIGLLNDYRGIMQTDGYQVYSIFEKKEGVLLLSCWAHARRYWEACLKENKARANYALTQIGMLYEIERMADERDLNYEERAALRSRLAYPILVGFEKWLYKNLLEVSTGPKGLLYKALHYNYTLFYRLSRYHLDGRMKLDNNAAESAIRPLALGRKNFLFCQNDESAQNAAVIYSLLGCCKAAQVNPQEWLTDILQELPQYNSDYSLDLADLLPHNWKQTLS